MTWLDIEGAYRNNPVVQQNIFYVATKCALNLQAMTTLAKGAEEMRCSSCTNCTQDQQFYASGGWVKPYVLPQGWVFCTKKCAVQRAGYLLCKIRAHQRLFRQERERKEAARMRGSAQAAHKPLQNISVIQSAMKIPKSAELVQQRLTNAQLHRTIGQSKVRKPSSVRYTYTKPLSGQQEPRQSTQSFLKPFGYDAVLPQFLPADTSLYW